MKRHIKTLVLTAASIAATTTAAMPAQACGGRSGRSYVSVSRSRYPVVRQPVYVRPVQSACGTPRVVQPPVHMPQPVQQPIQPVQQPLQPVQQPIQHVGGINRQPVRPVAPVNQVNPAAATTPAATTAAPQVSTPVQAVTPASNASATNSPTAEASALQMLAAMSASQAAPATAAAQPAQQAASQIPQFTAANQQPAANHVGTWKANLGNNQAVELTLKADGSFVWTAVRSGKSSTFEGQFRLESGRLTLVRSNDLQQMAGSWSGAGNQFTFKLRGATTGSLAFQRT